MGIEPINDMKKYYAVINNEQQDPFTIEELGEKEISASTLILTKEMEDWTEARNIDELKTILKKLLLQYPINLIRLTI